MSFTFSGRQINESEMELFHNNFLLKRPALALKLNRDNVSSTSHFQHTFEPTPLGLSTREHGVKRGFSEQKG